jgi:hypothetical protein
MENPIEYKPGRHVQLSLAALEAFPASLFAHDADGGSHGHPFHEFLFENYVVSKFHVSIWRSDENLAADAQQILKVICHRAWDDDTLDRRFAIWPSAHEVAEYHPVDVLRHFIDKGYMNQVIYQRFVDEGFRLVGVPRLTFQDQPGRSVEQQVDPRPLTNGVDAFGQGNDHVVADSLLRVRVLEEDKGEPLGMSLVTRSSSKAVSGESHSDFRIATRRDLGVLDVPSLAQLSAEQRQDEEWGRIIKVLETKDEDSQEYRRWLEDFMVREEDGILVRQSKWIRLGVIVQREQIVVPEKFVDVILAYAHTSRVGGHFGVTRTYYKLCENFWWSAMKQDIYRYVTNCHTCISNSRNTPKKSAKAPLQKYEVSRRFQIVMMDILGGLPETTKGNKSILVMTDAFTKYTTCTAVPNTTAETIAQAMLDEWIMRFGPPESILTDRGVQFTGRVIEHLCLMLGIRKIFTTAYHPETDGQTERFNSSLLKLLRVYADGNQINWDIWLMTCCHVYNTSVHATTRMTPYELMFGSLAPEFFELAAAWKVRDVKTKHETESHSKEGSWATRLNQAIKVACALAYKYTMKSKDDYARYYNAKLIASRVDGEGVPIGPKWKDGDLIYLWTPRAAYQGTSKLTPQWVGPYRIDKVINEVNVLASDVRSGHQLRAHVNRLRKVSEDVIEVSNIPLVDDGGILPTGYHVIDRIIGARQKQGLRKEYKVKWLDRSVTWESDWHLPETLIWDYEIANGTRSFVDQDWKLELEKTTKPSAKLKPNRRN